MFKTNAIIAAALCTVGLFAAPTAFAGTMEVHYKDLDLTTVAGQKALDRRITFAARRVCGYDQLTSGSRLPDADAIRCVKQAVTQAQDHVALAIAKASDNRLGG